jgi:hypothetical protein
VPGKEENYAGLESGTISERSVAGLRLYNCQCDPRFEHPES